MDYIKNFIKPLLYIFIIIIGSLLILTPLNYYDILNGSITTIFKIIIPIIAFLVGGFILGKNSKKKGWLEGLKLSLVSIIIFILINYIGYGEAFRLKSLIFYITLIISSVFGSMVGINKKLTKD
ncbi:MAG: TIGR04086 family membrane protein [Bacilli bacterium]